jgi:hypothetical protein
MPMQLQDFPRWLRGLFAVFLILFFFNALYALAFFTALWSLRIDPGVATLIGAIVGLGIVAWQARLGFRNLILSQEHRQLSRLKRARISNGWTWSEKIAALMKRDASCWLR